MSFKDLPMAQTEFVVDSAIVTHEGKDGKTVTYAEMVRNLFKPMGGVGSRMMHAAIGMAGESGELREARGRKNILEELGDTEFYVEAAWHELSCTPRQRQDAWDFPSYIPSYIPSIGNVLDHMHIVSAQVLDYAKKVWVYGGSKGNRDKEIATSLRELEYALKCFYEMLGVKRQDVMKLNMLKLLGSTDVSGRYESGKYSDQQALARADKDEPSSGRKFMSDAPK